MPINPELRKLTMTVSISQNLLQRLDAVCGQRKRSEWVTHQIRLAVERAERKKR